MPSPAPSCAPSINPGRSATTNVRPSSRPSFPVPPSAFTTPRFGSKRRERIVGDFRPRRGNHRNQRGLAGIRKTHQPDIGKQFQLQPQMTFLARMALFMLARRLVPGLRKMLVAATAASAVRNQHALAGRSQVRHGLAGLLVESQRADGNLQNHVLAGMPGAVRAFAVPPAVRLEFAVVAVAQQGVVVRDSLPDKCCRRCRRRRRKDRRAARTSPAETRRSRFRRPPAFTRILASSTNIERHSRT